VQVHGPAKPRVCSMHGWGFNCSALYPLLCICTARSDSQAPEGLHFSLHAIKRSSSTNSSAPVWSWILPINECTILVSVGGCTWWLMVQAHLYLYSCTVPVHGAAIKRN
jgi:hypothetical protein